MVFAKAARCLPDMSAYMNISSRRSRDNPFVTAKRAVRIAPKGSFSACAPPLCLWLAPQAASAQGRLDAQYEATLAGIPVGKGAWTIEIGDDTFSASAQGGTAGLLKAFSGGTGSGASQGRVVGGALVGECLYRYHHDAEEVRNHPAPARQRQCEGFFDRSGAAGRSRPRRRHRRAPQGRARSMTGSMLRVPGNAEVLSPTPAAPAPGFLTGGCATTSSSITSAWRLWGPSGAITGRRLVCAIYFTPVAGYIPDRPVIKYLATERRIEIAFVPIAGTRVLVPFRMTIPTPFGLAMLEATSFVT